MTKLSFYRSSDHSKRVEWWVGGGGGETRVEKQEQIVDVYSI